MNESSYHEEYKLRNAYEEDGIKKLKEIGLAKNAGAPAWTEEKAMRLSGY